MFEHDDSVNVVPIQFVYRFTDVFQTYLEHEYPATHALLKRKGITAATARTMMNGFGGTGRYLLILHGTLPGDCAEFQMVDHCTSGALVLDHHPGEAARRFMQRAIDSVKMLKAVNAMLGENVHAEVMMQTNKPLQVSDKYMPVHMHSLRPGDRVLRLSDDDTLEVLTFHAFGKYNDAEVITKAGTHIVLMFGHGEKLFAERTTDFPRTREELIEKVKEFCYDHKTEPHTIYLPEPMATVLRLTEPWQEGETLLGMVVRLNAVKFALE